MEPVQRTRLLSAAVLATVLASGVLLGLALDMSLVGGTDEGASSDRVQETRTGERRSQRPTPMYRQVGELTDDQDARIDSIIDAHRDSLRALQREFSEAYDPRYWGIIENTRESIRSILTPVQAERYDSLLAEYDDRRRRKDDTDGRRE